MKKIHGTSFIEILVVMAIFAILGLLVSRIILVTLRGSNKSEALVKVRENLDYALAVMERQLRNANGVAPCTGTSSTRIDYTDELGNSSYFECITSGSGSDVYVGSGLGRLTNNEVVITFCNIVCASSGTSQPSVTITLEARDAHATSIESAKVSSSTQIFLRTYGSN